MEFCPECGAKAARTDGDATLRLPRLSRHDALDVHVGATPLFECAGCGSTWLDTETFTTLCANREAHGAIADMLGPKTVGVTATAASAVRYLPCPTCTKVMNRENFGHRSKDVEVAGVPSGLFDQMGINPAQRDAPEPRMRHVMIQR